MVASSVVPPLFVDNIEKTRDMDIKSKYNVGDIIFTIDGFKIVRFEVKSVSVLADENGVSVYYNRNGSYHSYPEKECFDSENSLINFIKRAENGEND